MARQNAISIFSHENNEEDNVHDDSNEEDDSDEQQLDVRDGNEEIKDYELKENFRSMVTSIQASNLPTRQGLGCKGESTLQNDGDCFQEENPIRWYPQAQEKSSVLYRNKTA